MERLNSITVVGVHAMVDGMWHVPAAELAGIFMFKTSGICKMDVSTCISCVVLRPAGAVKKKFRRSSLSVHVMECEAG